MTQFQSRISVIIDDTTMSSLCSPSPSPPSSPTDATANSSPSTTDSSSNPTYESFSSIKKHNDDFSSWLASQEFDASAIIWQGEGDILDCMIQDISTDCLEGDKNEHVHERKCDLVTGVSETDDNAKLDNDNKRSKCKLYGCDSTRALLQQASMIMKAFKTSSKFGGKGERPDAVSYYEDERDCTQKGSTQSEIFDDNFGERSSTSSLKHSRFQALWDHIISSTSSFQCWRGSYHQQVQVGGIFDVRDCESGDDRDDGNDTSSKESEQPFEFKSSPLIHRSESYDAGKDDRSLLSFNDSVPTIKLEKRQENGKNGTSSSPMPAEGGAFGLWEPISTDCNNKLLSINFSTGDFSSSTAGQFSSIATPLAGEILLVEDGNSDLTQRNVAQLSITPSRLFGEDVLDQNEVLTPQVKTPHSTCGNTVAPASQANMEDKHVCVLENSKSDDHKSPVLKTPCAENNGNSDPGNKNSLIFEFTGQTQCQHEPLISCSSFGDESLSSAKQKWIKERRRRRMRAAS